MSYVITTEKELNQIVAPNLPLATIEYNQQYQDQLNNVLRLYFNRVDSLVGQLTASSTIPQLTNYTVATLPSATTAGVRAFVTDATAPAFGVTVVGGGAVSTPVYSDGTNWKVG